MLPLISSLPADEWRVIARFISWPFTRPFHITMALFQLHQSIKMKRCRSICVDSGFFSKKIFLHVNGTYRLKNSLFLILLKFLVFDKSYFFREAFFGWYLNLMWTDGWDVQDSLLNFKTFWTLLILYNWELFLTYCGCESI